MTHPRRGGQWDRRIHRANELISTYPFAAEGLRFYARTADLQRGLYLDAAEALTKSARTPQELPLRELLANLRLFSRFAKFAAQVQQFAPEPLARAAAQLAAEHSEALERAIEDFLRDGLTPRGADDESEDAGDEFGGSTLQERLLAWLFLQPFAEFSAERREPAKFDSTPSACPVCGSNPIVGVLRPEGDGGKKSLICMLCAYEWAFRRIYCPACGEEREPQMGFYAATEIPHVRVDVCDTCHMYLKTVDLTKTGLAVPVVDELAALPLDLWARDHGYEKLQINLIGS